MAAVHTSEDPLTRALEISKEGTAETRAARHHADALARQTSNEIDDWLKKDASKQNERMVRILLLGTLRLPTAVYIAHRALSLSLQGQAESG